MPKEFSRTGRVADVLQRELAQIIQKEMRDPRVGMITISEVRVTKDLAQAKVFVSILDDNEDKVKQVMKALNDAAGFLRSQLAGKLTLRTTPKLFFTYDDSLIRGNRLHKLIDEAVAKDKPNDDEH